MREAIPEPRPAETRRSCARPRRRSREGRRCANGSASRATRAPWARPFRGRRAGPSCSRRRRPARSPFAGGALRMSLDPRHDPVRRRRQPSAGRAGRWPERRRRRARSCASGSEARSASTCRPCRATAPGGRRGGRRDAPPAVRADRGQRLRLPPDRPRRERAAPRRAGRADPPGAAPALCSAAPSARLWPITLDRPPAVIARTDAWLALLERRIGGAVALRAEPGSPYRRAMSKAAALILGPARSAASPRARAHALLQPGLPRPRPAELARRRLSHPRSARRSGRRRAQ